MKPSKLFSANNYIASYTLPLSIFARCNAELVKKIKVKFLLQIDVYFTLLYLT